MNQCFTGVDNNVCIGTLAGYSMKQNCKFTVGVGIASAQNSAGEGVFIGHLAGRDATNGATGTIAIGYNAGNTNNNSNNNILIGRNALPTSSATTNRLMIGNATGGLHGTNLYNNAFRLGVNKYDPAVELEVQGMIRSSNSGTNGIFQGYDEHHSIHMRHNATNVMRFYEFGEYQFYNNGLLPSQAMRLRIDANGFLEVIPKSQQAFAVRSIGYARGVGESFSYTQGSGAYKPYAVGTFTNTAYTVAGGNVKAGLTATSNTNHSAFDATSDDVLCDWKGLYQVHLNVNLSNLSGATTAVFLRLYKGAVAVESATKTLINGAIDHLGMTTLVDVNSGDALSMYIQPDTQTVSIVNNSTFRITYIG
jgi:hypothetical protein